MKGEAGTSLSKTEYTAGIFFGIAILQEDIYHPSTIKTGGSWFVEGLNVFDNLSNFLIIDNSLHSLFKSYPVTANGMISLLRRDKNCDPNIEIIEKMNFLSICKFLKKFSVMTFFISNIYVVMWCLGMDISFFLYYIDGLINIHVAGENKPMCLEDVMQFLTGKRIIAPGDKSVIQVLVIKATEDEFGRPAVSTCAQKFTATLAEEYKVVRDVWVETVAQLIVGFTLN